MSREQIPITPEILIWARKRTGFSLDEARKDFPHIEAWEQGKTFPTYKQLEKLSDKFKIPVAVFFFPKPPDTPPLRESFRTLPKAQFDSLPRPLPFLLRKAQAFQIGLSELNDGRNPAEQFILRDLPPFTPGIKNIAAMAHKVRDYLGVSLNTQINWKDKETAFKFWREALEQCGIAVFKDAFRSDLYSGFCLYDEIFPLIYINNSAKAREIFTLFHELAHLLFQTSGIDTLGDASDNVAQDATAQMPDARRVEVLCNQFAAEFLLPKAKLEEDIRGSVPTEEMARNLADRYKVSRELVFRRFLDQGYIDKDEYNKAAKKWADQRKKKGPPGGDYYKTKVVYLGTNYINLAFSRYYQNHITEPELADYLDVKVRNLLALEDAVATKAA